MRHYEDLTIDEALADPLIRDVMAADSVDAGELEGLLRAIARRWTGLRARPGAAASRPSEDLGDKDRRPRPLDCCHVLASGAATSPRGLASGLSICG